VPNKLTFSTLIAAALAFGVSSPAAAQRGGHAGGHRGGGSHSIGSTSTSRGTGGAAAGGGFGRGGLGRPRGLGPSAARNPYYGGAGVGWGLYSYADPWWGDVGPYDYYPYEYDGYADTPTFTDEAGGVRLQVNPKDADVYVDGGKAGVVDDFDGHFQSLKLSPGVHHIELRASGYAPLAFDVNIEPGQTLQYQDSMKKSKESGPQA
jgi:PEGA domain-containing protein